jgi:hypothetical protein
MPKRKQKSYSWAYRARHLQRGLCGQCPRKADPGRTLCSIHRAMYNKKQRKAKAALIAAGRCRTCTKPLCESDRGLMLCRECMDRSAHRGRMKL